MLGQAEQDRISDAIAAAERTTSGEIVCVIAHRASSYRSFAVALPAAIGFAVPIPLLLLTNMSAERIYLIQLAVAALVAFALMWMPLRLALVPRPLGRLRAREAAHRQFAARGLAQTEHRTGALIFIAVTEHYAEIIADDGIASRVEAEVWRETLTKLVEDIRSSRAADGMVAAVQQVGAILAQHHPPRPGDRNELPNHVIVL
ncbi:TPM domain-containing protein [Chelatococcus reniformis]|uniref:TPM domain-containing protein n=1 Tax=Chelatococcus reniformis TaxID=1494448 RepID=A0A916X854_9HYPH|nr:TPM domain-containing protein [Chelatococcus reniformis]GGC49781.1 hypothetical protein GCM10010994_06150 [Chelatococcus reniformis]